jgi:hypothetical protein
MTKDEWKAYKKWSKEANESLKGKPILREENVVDSDNCLIKDSYGTVYQGTFNSANKFSGVKRISKRRHEK